MKAKSTLKKIAKEFEVSISTVSKALSDSPEISEATKIKIKEYAKLQNYKPNSIAKNLKNQRSNSSSKSDRKKQISNLKNYIYNIRSFN